MNPLHTRTFSAAIGLFALLLVLVAEPVGATTQDITGQFSITRSGLVLNRATNTYDSTVTIKNASSTPVLAPIAAAVSGLPTSVTLANKAGTTTEGKPYVSPTLPGSILQPGGTLSFTLKFSNPQRIAFTSTLQILYTGDLPPDPGPAGDATVAGVDTNGNGVRDDVERWLAIRFPNLQQRLAITQAAKALQQVLVGGTSAGAQDRALALSKAVACMSARFPTVADARSAYAELGGKMINTEQRFLADSAWRGAINPGLFPNEYANDGCDF